MGTCLECDLSLKGLQKKFCSEKCRKANWKKTPKGRVKNNDWNRNYFRRKARESWKEIKCFVCSKMFLPVITHKGQQIYCSPKCAAFIVRKVSWHNTRVKRLYGSNEKITCEQWKKIVESAQWYCQICGKDFENNKFILELDHIVPLSKGGHHSANNIRVSCRKCNRKNDTSFKSKITL